MKKQLFGLFFLVLLIITLFAQNPPDTLWTRTYGGIGWDVGNGITIDDAGNSYVTGYFRETATFGSYSLTSSGWRDIFIAKLNCTLSIENEINPTEIGLSNYPNPFNPSTTISLQQTAK